MLKWLEISPTKVSNPPTIPVPPYYTEPESKEKLRIELVYVKLKGNQQHAMVCFYQ